jgi:cell division protein FtsQ
MSAIRPLDDGAVLLADDLPKIRARPEDDEPYEFDEPGGNNQPDDEQWLDNDEPVADWDWEEGDIETVVRRPIGHILAALLMLAGLAAGGAYLLQPDTLPIRQVRIEGEFRQLSQPELQAIVLEHLRGGFFSVNMVAVRDAVRTEPWVREVWVQRVWPDALQVSVREQVAVARWGEIGLVSQSGDYFEPDAARQVADLPVLIGPDGTQEQMVAKLNLAQELLAPLGLQLERLEVSERRAWSFTTVSGLEVVLGRDDFERRLRRFVDLVPHSLGDRLGEAAYVDMRYTNGFAVRFNNEGGAPAERDGAA